MVNVDLEFLASDSDLVSGWFELVLGQFDNAFSSIKPYVFQSLEFLMVFSQIEKVFERQPPDFRWTDKIIFFFIAQIHFYTIKEDQF